MKARIGDFEERHIQQTFIARNYNRWKSGAKGALVIYIQQWSQDPAVFLGLVCLLSDGHALILPPSLIIHSARHQQTCGLSLPCQGDTGLLSHRNTTTIIARRPSFIMRRILFTHGLGINLMEPEQGKQGKRDEQVHCQGDILPRKKHWTSVKREETEQLKTLSEAF